MLLPLDGPSTQIKITGIGTATPVQAKVGASAFTDRKVITLQPTGKMKVYFSDGSVPSAATVLANGFTHFKDAKETYEVGEKQVVYLLAETGTIDVIIAERA